MRAATLVLAAVLTGCQVSDASQSGVQTKRYRNIGRDASSAEIRAWDIDANSDGSGLPTGRGTYAKGVDVYAKQCASCHGPKGEGIAPYPRLIGAEPKNFPFGDDPKSGPKTIGNYWPYATTLYDYINRAMPFQATSTLKPDEVYSVVAFLLAENGIIGKDAVMNSRTLPAVKMPARDRFVLDDRKGGPTFR